ncbi:MAG: hypothetical protein AAGL69_08610 [Pseudomonadota bacterium]
MRFAVLVGVFAIMSGQLSADESATDRAFREGAIKCSETHGVNSLMHFRLSLIALAEVFRAGRTSAVTPEGLEPVFEFSHDMAKRVSPDWLNCVSAPLATAFKDYYLPYFDVVNRSVRENNREVGLESRRILKAWIDVLDTEDPNKVLTPLVFKYQSSPESSDTEQD